MVLEGEARRFSSACWFWENMEFSIFLEILSERKAFLTRSLNPNSMCDMDMLE